MTCYGDGFTFLHLSALYCGIKNLFIIGHVLWLRHYTTSRKVAGSRSDVASDFFLSVELILQAALGPGVYEPLEMSTRNINEQFSRAIERAEA
jgi:hypothetical protein